MSFDPLAAGIVVRRRFRAITLKSILPLIVVRTALRCAPGRIVVALGARSSLAETL